MRHNDDVCMFGGFVVDIHVHRRERILVDDSLSGISEVDRVGLRVGSHRREIRKVRIHLVEKVGRIHKHPLRIVCLSLMR